MSKRLFITLSLRKYEKKVPSYLPVCFTCELKITNNNNYDYIISVLQAIKTAN